MAKRRSKEQMQSDKIIKANLLKLGERILDKSVPTSRRDTGRLQDEQNFRVYNDVNLRVWQMEYGKWNFPAGKTSGEKNALLIAVKEEKPKATKIIVSELTEIMIQPFKNKK